MFRCLLTYSPPAVTFRVRENFKELMNPVESFSFDLFIFVNAYLKPWKTALFLEKSVLKNLIPLVTF